MHRFLPAIGFRQITKKSQFQKLLKTVIESPDSKVIIPTDDEVSCTLYTKEVEEGIGLAVCGETDNDGTFQMEYYFPYILSDVCSTNAECLVEHQSDRESYNGVCDDVRLGLNLIFFVNNFMEYKAVNQLKKIWPGTLGMCLSGLSVNGKVLLPIGKTKQQLEMIRKENSRCVSLQEAARQGDQAAMEDLAVRDMNLYTQAKQRVLKQDMYSFIETFFMPCGVECDQYTVMGYITSSRKTVNRLSEESLYILEIQCNDMPIRVCIGEADLLGVPKPGYRFKGDIWLQGRGILALD